MVGGQDFLFALFGIGIAAFVFTAGFAAVFAAVALPTVLEAEANDVLALAMRASDCLSNHAPSLP